MSSGLRRPERHFGILSANNDVGDGRSVGGMYVVHSRYSYHTII